VPLGKYKFGVIRKFDPSFGANSTQHIGQWDIGKSEGGFFIEESCLLGKNNIALKQDKSNENYKGNRIMYFAGHVSDLD
jgi:hypothetical protein